MDKAVKPNIIASSSIVVAAPIEEVWKLLAEEFGEIGKWASGVDHSEGMGESIGGSDCSERACTISATGFNDTKERILVYDEKKYLLQYELFHGLPGFVHDAVNSWSLKQEGTATEVSAHTTMYAKGVLGFVLRGFMTSSTRKALRYMCEELQHYLEKGKPHPRKTAAMAKYQRKQAKVKAI
ncbi:MAG: SRPBCC family protein [Bacteroidota bacterium]